MRCPICDDDLHSLTWLGMHMEDSHPDETRHAQVVIASSVPASADPVKAKWPGFSAGFPGVDIDAAHLRHA